MDGMKNLLLTGLATGLVVALGFIGYTYQTKDIVPKGEIIKLKQENQNVDFEDLQPSIQNEYISKTRYYDELSELESQKKQLEQELEDLNTKNRQDLLGKTALVQKETDSLLLIEEEKTPLIKDSSKEKKTFKTYTCKKFVKGSIQVPNECKRALYQFIEKHQDSVKEFEVIGMVDNTEFKLIKNLEDVYGTKEVKEVKKYVQIGLSRQRVIETTWLIKEHLDKKIPLETVNYTVYSDNKRGFVVRAYF